MCVLWIVLISLLENCSGYIYYLNESEYARMPPIFHLDPYDTCLHENNGSGVYCSVKMDLVTDEPNGLFTMMKEYSDKTEVHFNHTKLSYGICLTKTCKQYQLNTTRDRVAILEACLNDTMWENFKLKTRVDDKIACVNLEEEINVNTCDVLVAVLLVILLFLNLIGSLQEAYFGKLENSGLGISVLSCFSIYRNWRKLLAPAGEVSDPRLTSLTGFYGIKAINIILVIMFHSVLPYVLNLENPHYFEEAYHKWYYQLVVNGTLVVQTFFIMSGFLLAYNMQLNAENHKTNWFSVPQTIIARWMRLTPPYIVVLAVSATWMRYFGSGPLWQTVVISEVEDCQRYWWHHLLYINNYVDYSQCVEPSWYIAADFQLFFMGVTVCGLTSGSRRKMILVLLFVVGLLASVALTYLQDLNGVLLITPEVSRNLLILDPTFINTYKLGHTNMPSFVIGLSVGLLVYHWQCTGYKLHRYLRHRFLFWMTVPACLCLILLGSVFYRDAPRDSVYIRMLYAAFMKPLWGIILGYFIIGMVFRYEEMYRSVVEWRGWAAPSRVSYCAYLLHIMLIRVLTGTRRNTMHLSILHLIETTTSSVTISFLAAVPFHLLVEAPFLQLIKIYTSGSRHNDTNNQTEVEKPDHKSNGIHSDGHENSDKVCDDGQINGIEIDVLITHGDVDDANKEIGVKDGRQNEDGMKTD